MGAIDTRIPKVYAQALADLVDHYGKTLKEFDDFMKMVTEHEDLQLCLTGEVFSPEEKERVLKDLLDKSKYSKEFSSFLIYLAKNNRIELISSIFTRFKEEIYKREQIAVGKIRSKFKINNDFMKDLTNQFERILDKKVEFQQQIDQSLLGGFVLELDGSTYDFSVSKQLNHLNRELISTQI